MPGCDKGGFKTGILKECLAKGVKKKMTNKVAIMQPYAFPYIGYMNLVNASDKFVFYDDVNFIKKGWINRNRIMLGGDPYRFTIPLQRQSQNVMIKDTEVSDLTIFAEKFLNQLDSEYKNAPYKTKVLDYVRDVLINNHKNISEVAIASVELFFDYVGIEKNFHCSSIEFASTRGLEKAERLIKITKLLDSCEYINAMGGTLIYAKDFFASNGIVLNFVKPCLVPYVHCNGKGKVFNPGLSVIDIMMNISEYEIRNYLDSYELV